MTNFGFLQFSGHWYNVASYASDKRNINDCATLEFQEDNLGYTLRETFVEPDAQLGNRSQKTYFARVDPTFDAANRAKFVISYESGGKYNCDSKSTVFAESHSWVFRWSRNFMTGVTSDQCIPPDQKAKFQGEI